ncbi:serine hydrolase domain-containing protein [Actinosynnema sp. NPDC047251]|uniref:Alkaline D-peptidase n=1 Tax=Saccharothrix espanaensis (strain ATCC 51144 / DSM 44229 / JCM 9112 / NBRC 15066 / NRRL 15764) TaxID=1179773 RepID=K3W489_SACES|nr:serine hydrolase domain-containing protein [Saccharothrix espanaensis]CCH27533.1 Alkaline D-peptidase [Saccharothrix espanaensis DSM 44229]
MKTSVRRVGAAALTLALLTGIAGQAGASEEDPSAQTSRHRTELRQAMDDVVAAGGAGVVVRVHDRRGDWAGSAGVAELGKPGKPGADWSFRAGSITKVFVATVVLQLVDEGRVELDESAAHYLPGYGLDRRITVRMLLQHTSGLYNYTGDAKADGTPDPGIPIWGQDYVDNMFRTYRAEDLVRSALAKPARFEPGARHSYSNTNYALAGLLIEKVSRTDYATQVERRILKPLRLRGTSLPGTRTGIPGPNAHSYIAYRHEGRLKVVDGTTMNPSWAGAAGEIISSTEDLDTFIDSLVGGRLLSSRSLAEMRRTVPTAGVDRVGLGLFEYRFTPDCAAIGHTGGTQSVTSYLFTTPDRTKRVEFSITHGVLDGGDPASREKFDAAHRKLATVALCGTAG